MSSAARCAAPARSLAGHQRRGRSRARSADAAARSGPVRAGAVQPARQRREICAARHRRSRSRRRSRRRQSSCCRCWTRATAFRRTISSGSSTSSIASAAGDRQRAGTGLGLAICRGFVEAMGGTISAANRDDRSGAVFTITVAAACAGRRPPGSTRHDGRLAALEDPRRRRRAADPAVPAHQPDSAGL